MRRRSLSTNRAVEKRLDDGGCAMESVCRDNAEFLEKCQAYHAEYIFIDEEYQVEVELQ